MALGVWVTASVGIHLFYIKRIRLTKEAVLPVLRITDGTALRVHLPGSLFRQSESTLPALDNQSASASVHAGLGKLADYLMTHPHRRLTVTGYYTRAESRSTLISNVGAIRAQTVKQYLLNAGVPEDQLQIQSQLSESLRFIRDSTSALSFAFEPVVIDAQWLARHQRYIDLFHPLHLYFPTGSTDYIHTPDNEQFAQEAIAYLRDHPRERLVITGHTDSTGTPARNHRLSQQRAVAVRDQLVRQGVLRQRFRIVALGDRAPIEPNALPEGREANRRVTLVVQRK